MRLVTPLVVVFGLVAALLGSAVLAQTYPSKPVRLIVTYPPAGSSDLMARIWPEALGLGVSRSWSRTRRRRGLDRHGYAAHQTPDGYTSAIWADGGQSDSFQGALDVEREFVSVSLIATGPSILVVNPSTQAKTL
jgi:tripartite-type tricarboxylate transporter receptor subunit TctC